MADATVSPARREETLTLGREPAAEPVERATPAIPRPLVILWAGMVVALVAFLAFGSVRIGAGNWIGRRMPIREIWSRFVGYLMDEGASTALVLGVTTAAAIALIGSGYALWLAFALRDAPAIPPPVDAVER